MNVGVIGLGMMGSQIALRLALKGHKVNVFNRDRSKAEKLLHASGTAINLKIVDEPKEIGNSSDIAIICVKDYQAVTNVSFMTEGLIETTNRDQNAVCSNIRWDNCCKERGSDFDCNLQSIAISMTMMESKRQKMRYLI
jgi:3-hydroxyisobutyrate dehydrogenase-like beta-hydroxyacid dehydrogenase